MLSGKHYINGQWQDSQHEQSKINAVFGGETLSFNVAGAEESKAAAQAAREAFTFFSQTSRSARAELLDTIALEIDELGDQITAVAMQETALPEARLVGERGRTTAQLKTFARYIEQGDYLDKHKDEALPDRTPAPRPELRSMQVPIGPVAVFGASNFPLAFSVAGGDTAAALAAGCPVVVKGHPAHPGTGELVALAIAKALEKCAMPAGIFSFLQAGSVECGAALVQNPAIKAVGFTGSLKGGRALFDLCAQRSEPIPFFGELGSVNPVFLLENALKEKASDIAAAWADSLKLGAGQFCTNPGIVIVPLGEAGDAFVSAARQALQASTESTMLTQGIAESYRNGVQKLNEASEVESLVVHVAEGRQCGAAVFAVDASDFLENEALQEEVFGPSGLIVRSSSIEQTLKIASSLHGQLTCTVHMNDADNDEAKKLISILQHKAGRILVNGFPTGVEVCGSMIHGGPYPASTNFGFTSVGTQAIRRFLRPVCFQNLPEALWPSDE